MKNLPFPIKVHSGLSLKISQPYGAVGEIEWYKARGIEIPFHNGIDILLTGTDRQNYGTPLITPSEGWQIIKTSFDSPMSTKGNGVTIQSSSFTEDGIVKILQCVLWHCSEIESKKGILPKYEHVAYMGNSGAVKPEPSTSCPYCGTHLHLMLFEFFFLDGRWRLQNSNNGVNGAIDPMTRFSFDVIIKGDDTGISKDTPPLLWAFDKLGLKEAWQKIIFLYKLFIK